MKRKFNKWGLVFIVAMICVLGIGTSKSAMVVSAKTTSWSQDGIKWTKNNKFVFIFKNQLLMQTRTNGSTSAPVPVVKWKMDEYSQSLSIATVNGNTAYVQLYSEGGKSVLYSVNIKAKKKKVISRKFYATASAGNYVYASNAHIADTGAYSRDVWKVNGPLIKKVRRLGKHIFGTIVVKNNLYYGKYAGKSQRKVTIYRAKLDGSRPKKLFSVQGKGKYAQVLLTSADKKEITVVASGETSKTYVYKIKSKKLKVKKTV